MKRSITIPKIKQFCSIDRIAIYGSADVDENHPLYQETFKIAQHLASMGKTIVDGGGPGVMAAATLGAQSAQGKTISVTFQPVDMPEFEGQYTGNKTDLEIKTANYVERMFGLMEQADAYVCMQGGTGTLSEWATAWLLAHLHYGNHKPLILYGEFWREVMATIEKHFFVGEKEREVYKIVTNLDELTAAVQTFEAELHDRCNLPQRA